MELTPFTSLLVPLGTILGAAIALAGTYTVQNTLWRLDVLKDARAIRDAKFARLRGLYEEIVVGYFACYQTQTRDDRMAIIARMREARARLLLEPEASDVVGGISVLIDAARRDDVPGPSEQLIGDIVSDMRRSFRPLQQPLRKV